MRYQALFLVTYVMLAAAAATVRAAVAVVASESHHWKKCSMMLIAVNALNNRPDSVPKTNAGQIAGLVVFEEILL